MLKDPCRLVCFGTSLTASWTWRFWRKSGGAWVRVLETEARDRGLNLDCINVARWGADSNWAVNEARLRNLPKHLDALFLEFAINDSDTRRGISIQRSCDNLKQISATLSEPSRVILATMNPCAGRHRLLRPQHDDYVAAHRSVALQEGWHLIDLYADWTRMLDANPARFRALVPDGIHPNTRAAKEFIVPVMLNHLTALLASEANRPIHDSAESR